MDLSNFFDDMLEYQLLDGSKFVDGTYAPEGGNMPTVGYAGELAS